MMRRPALAIVVAFTWLVGCSSPSQPNPEGVAAAKRETASEEIAARVTQANTDRQTLEADHQTSLDNAVATFSDAMKTGDLDALLTVVTDDLAEQIRFRSVTEAWRGTGAISVMGPSIDLGEVTAPELIAAPVFAGDGAAEQAEAYVPQINLAGSTMPYTSFEPAPPTLPTTMRISFSVDNEDEDELSLTLVREADTWLISEGDLIAPVDPSNLANHEFAASHLWVGDLRLSNLFTASDERPVPILIGTYDLTVEEGYDQSVAAFPNIEGIDLHDGLPNAELTDEVVTQAKEHVHAVVKASIDDPTCRNGIGHVTVGGIEEHAPTGCNVLEDNEIDKLRNWDPSEVETSFVWNSDTTNSFAYAEISGAGDGPLVQVDIVKAFLGEREPAVRQVSSATVKMTVDQHGALVTLQIADNGWSGSKTIDN